MAIINYYQSLDRNSKTKFIKDICGLTDMASSTFHAKIKNNTFTKLEREAIMNYITKYQK